MLVDESKQCEQRRYILRCEISHTSPLNVVEVRSAHSAPLTGITTTCGYLLGASDTILADEVDEVSPDPSVVAPKRLATTLLFSLICFCWA